MPYGVKTSYKGKRTTQGKYKGFYNDEALGKKHKYKRPKPKSLR